MQIQGFPNGDKAPPPFPIVIYGCQSITTLPSQQKHDVKLSILHSLELVQCGRGLSVLQTPERDVTDSDSPSHFLTTETSGRTELTQSVREARC